MKEYKVEVDLNQMTTPELDFMIDILYGKNNEAVKYIMDLKAFRKWLDVWRKRKGICRKIYQELKK